MKSQRKTMKPIRPSQADVHHVPFVDYSDMALKPGERKTPGWIVDQGLCFVGCWECLPWRRYSGFATTWLEQDYAFEHSQEFIDDIKKLGCNAVVVPYDCGHGEELNEADVQWTKEFISLAHASGLKVGTYFRPDIVWTETLSDKELAELEGGFQIDEKGQIVRPFGTCSANVCYHHPGALARFKRHVRRAIVELKTDMLHLDGMMIGHYEGMGACRCENCVADFRKFLVERYGNDREAAKCRFSHAYLEKVVPPANYPINWIPFDTGPIEPHWEEWTAFRCTWTSRILAEVASWAISLNPEVAIEVNNYLPSWELNNALWTGTDSIGIGYYTDASWSEDGYGPRMLDNGLLIQRVRQFKICRAVGTFGLTYMHEQEERALRQNLAHTAAFNEGNIGCIGFSPHMNFSNRYTVRMDIKCDFMKWLNDNRSYFRDARSAARIAVWRPRENMAMSGKMAYAVSMRMEQLLIETGRGFDMVFEESPSSLHRYDVVIAPDIECMSLQQIEGLIHYVERGGNLLVGQDTAIFDLWHRRRIENPWEALFGDASARNVLADAVAERPAGLFVTAGVDSQFCREALVTSGQGKAAYIPVIVDPASQPSMLNIQGGLETGLNYTNWVQPENAERINGMLDWLLEGNEPLKVSAERGVLVEYMSQETPRRTLVHMVNMGHEPQTSCVLHIQPVAEVTDISVLYPPTDRPAEWHIDSDDGGKRVVFDFLDTYVIVVLNKR